MEHQRRDSVRTLWGRFSIVWILLALQVFWPGTGQAQICEMPVDTAQGSIVGGQSRHGDACVWRGLPFAAPPVDTLRWRPPQPPEPWDGVRDGTEWAPRCAQKSAMALMNFDPSEEMSEDCLYLNIWRPKTIGPHPVMVWIHGGALYGGTPNTPFFDGSQLAERGDVVVVTIAYRLSVFGYLATEGLVEEDAHGSAGNYGLLDQIEALKWVEQNISGFGGDPERVTVFGESAGGWSTCALMASPLAEGLLDQAIIQSGGCEAVTSMARGVERGAEAAEALGCDPSDVECLRAVPWRRVLLRTVGFDLGGFVWLPRVDGWVLEEVPLLALASGHAPELPLLVGTNRDEVDAAVPLEPGRYFGGEAGYHDRLGRRFGSEAVASISQLYPLQSLGRPAAAWGQVLTDASIACPTMAAGMAYTRRGAPVWAYRFDYDDFLFGTWLGAAHAMELPFVFGTLGRLPVTPIFGPFRRRGAKVLSDQMVSSWTHFAHTGTPGAVAGVDWPAFSETGNLMILDQDIQTQPWGDDTRQRCQYWSAFTLANPWMAEAMGISGIAPTEGSQPVSLGADPFAQVSAGGERGPAMTSQGAAGVAP